MIQHRAHLFLAETLGIQRKRENKKYIASSLLYADKSALIFSTLFANLVFITQHREFFNKTQIKGIPIGVVESKPRWLTYPTSKESKKIDALGYFFLVCIIRMYNSTTKATL